MNSFDKFLGTIFIIILIWGYVSFEKAIAYSDPVERKAKVIEFIVDKDKDKFETVLEVDGEIIFKKDKAFYYKVRDKLNQEIDVTVKENKLKDKVVELKE